MSGLNNPAAMLAGDALALVNVARSAFGLDLLAELPSAMTGQSSDCVLARALRDITGTASVSESMMFEDRGETATTLQELWAAAPSGYTDSLRTPDTLVRFFGAFDRKEYPTLVEG